MGMKESIPNRQYTDEFKVEAVRLSESIGGGQAAKRLSIPDSSLWNWIRLSRTGTLKAADGTRVPVKRPVMEVEAENARLRRELASTKVDLDILKKAAVSSRGRCNAEMITVRRDHGTRSSSTYIGSGESGGVAAVEVRRVPERHWPRAGPRPWCHCPGAGRARRRRTASSHTVPACADTDRAGRDLARLFVAGDQRWTRSRTLDHQP